MSKFLATFAAAAVSALVALPASATERKSSGVTQSVGIEVGAARRHHTARTRITVRHWCGPQGRGCEAYRYGRRYHAPFAPYVYAYHYDRRPYFVPAPHVGFGPFGTGPFGFGTRQY